MTFIIWNLMYLILLTYAIYCVGDTRNDLYLSLERGEFERGGKSVQKNIEVTLYVLYADGDTLKV